MADKGYDSQDNRQALSKNNLEDGIMSRAKGNQALTKKQKRHNQAIQDKRWVIEQSFGTLKRRLQFQRASYFGLDKVQGQNLLKAICLNLIKASNKMSYV